MYYSVVLFIMLYKAGCEYSRFHSLLATGDVSRERRLRSQKFHTDDVDLSGIWSTSANVPSGDEREETAVFEGYVVQYFPKWMVVPKAFYQ